LASNSERHLCFRSFRKVLFYGKYDLDIYITTCDLFQKCFGCRRASFVLCSQWKWHVSAGESINLDLFRGTAPRRQIIFITKQTLVFPRRYFFPVTISLLFNLSYKIPFFLCSINILINLFCKMLFFYSMQ